MRLLRDYGGLPTMVNVPAVVDAVGERAMVLAAGGITDGRQVAASLCLGADGVWVGTRMLASHEARVHPEHHRASWRVQLGAISHDAVWERVKAR